MPWFKAKANQLSPLIALRNLWTASSEAVKVKYLHADIFITPKNIFCRKLFSKNLTIQINAQFNTLVSALYLRKQKEKEKFDNI